MVEHIVLIKLKPEVTQEQKQSLIQALRGLKGKTPGMVDLSAGETFTDRHDGYTIGLVVRFTDRRALDVYGPHPNHVPVKQMVGELADRVIAVDYDI